MKIFKYQNTKYFQNLKNERGVALLMAIFTVTLILYIVMEVSYETNIDYVANAQAVNRLKAYYASKAGVELSLLRINLYKKAVDSFGKQLGDNADMLNFIWSMPFSWPIIPTDEMSSIDKDNIKATSKDSLMDAQFLVTVEDEGSKIDINDLASPSKALQATSKKLILNIFENKIKNDEDWAQKNRDLKPEEIINNIIDWVDDDTESLNGGDESTYYSNLKQEGYPPNRGFRTIGEMRMVAGMTDELFNLLEKFITVYGMKAINPNHATKDVIKSIDPSITDEIATEVIERREKQGLGGPYKDAQDFWGFLAQKGINVDTEVQDKTPLVFDSLMNFRIKSTGTYSKSAREIVAIVYDIDKTANQLSAELKKQNPSPTPSSGTASPTPTPAPTNPQNPSQNSSKSGLQIVYWSEK